MNKVLLTGYFAADPELKHTPGDKPKPFVRFSMAVRRPHVKDRRADFLSCMAWGKLAEIVCQYAKKGTLAEVEGYYTIESYKPEGEEKAKSKHQIVVEQFYMLAKSNQGEE